MKRLDVLCPSDASSESATRRVGGASAWRHPLRAHAAGSIHRGTGDLFYSRHDEAVTHLRFTARRPMKKHAFIYLGQALIKSSENVCRRPPVVFLHHSLNSQRVYKRRRDSNNVVSSPSRHHQCLRRYIITRVCMPLFELVRFST